MIMKMVHLTACEEYLVRYGPQADADGKVFTKPDLIALTPDLVGKCVKIPSTGEIGMVYKFWFDDVGLRAQMIPKSQVEEFLKNRGGRN